MDFGLSDEQEMLRQSARDFVARVAPAEKAKEWDEQGDAPALFKALADVGWFALPFPEDAGGDGGGPTELLLIAEELGRSSFDVAMSYIGVFIPGLTVWKWGSTEQKEFVRDQVMTGKQRLAVALSEPDSGSDAAALRCRAEDKGDHYLLNGQKAWCTGAGVPNTQIAMYVRTGAVEDKHKGISLLLVDPALPGVEIRRVPTLARHILGTNDVFLRDVVVPKSALVGPQHEGWKVMLSNIELEKILITGGYLGAAQATLDDMLAYGKEREAFGRPIATFQALAHAMADLQTEIDAARLLAYRAAWLHEQGIPSGREGSMAKLKGSETYVAAARLGMQVLAGHGFSTESVMSFRYRESIVATISGGTSQIQRNAIARSMGLRTY